MDRPRNARRLVFAGLALTVGGATLAQVPSEPRRLPASVTGAPVAGPVTPAGVSAPATPQAASAAPVSRILPNLTQLPPETQASYYSFRAGADWLWRMNQPGGRFVAGINSNYGRAVEADVDARQALGTLALCEAARFTGDERIAARATGSVLALLTLTKVDPADASCREFTPGGERGGRVQCAAALVLAIARLPKAEAKLQADGLALAVGLAKRVAADGTISHHIEEKTVAVVEGGSSGVPIPRAAPLEFTSVGLVLEALTAAQSFPAAAPALGESIDRAMQKVRGPKWAEGGGRRTGDYAAAFLPVSAEIAARNPADAEAVKLAFELADQVTTCQVLRSSSQNPYWGGGIPLGGPGSEPTIATADAARGLALATKLTRQVGDATRYAKYRAATVMALEFCRSLQVSAENGEHFEKGFRTNYLLGGCRVGPSDGVMRPDSTGALVRAQAAYLTSGAEMGSP